MSSPKQGNKVKDTTTASATPHDSSSLPPLTGFDVDAFSQQTQELMKQLQPLAKEIGAVLKSCAVVKDRGAAEALSETEVPLKLGDALEQARSQLAPAKAVLEQLQTGIETWREAERRSRRHRFEEGAKTEQWTIYGNWPEPVINGIVFLVIDEQKDRATINGRPLAGLPTAERLLMSAADSLAELEKNLTRPEAFIANVWKAFSKCNGQPGMPIDVFVLLREMTWQRQGKGFARDPRTEAFRGYAAAQFRADLTRYLAAGAPLVEDGKTAFRLEVVGGSFSQDGLFMYFPQSQRLGTCGRLTFQATNAGSDT